MVLGVGAVVTLLALVGMALSLKDGGTKSLRPFDFFFLGAVFLAYAFGNYLWFVVGDKDTGQLVAIWVAGNIALGLYFRSAFTRTPINRE
jgi:hypothetical protein